MSVFANAPLALAIIIFFRKSFGLHGNALQLCLLAICGISATTELVIASTLALVTLAAVKATTSKISDLQIGIPNYDRGDALNFSVTLGFLSTLDWMVWTQLGSSAGMDRSLFYCWLSVPLLSLFQLVRNPTDLKNLLRPLRVALGPTSILMTIVSGILQARFGANQPFVTALAVLASASSFLAGIVLRPDNCEVIGVLPRCLVDGVLLPALSRMTGMQPKGLTATQTKRLITKSHGYFNILSVGIAVFITIHNLSSNVVVIPRVCR